MPATKNTLKKRVALSIFLTAALATVTFLGVQTERYISKKKQKKDYISAFPIIDLLTLNGKTYNTRLLAEAPMNKLVVVFDPDCEHCKNEIHDLLRNASKFDHTSILFISQQPAQSLKPFEDEINSTAPSKALLFGIDPGQLFKTFPISSFPEIFLYGKDNREISQHTGETPSNILISELKK
jgi:hypothetical protein